MYFDVILYHAYIVLSYLLLYSYSNQKSRRHSTFYYKEIFPLVPSILNGLWRIYSSIGATRLPSLFPDPALTVSGDTDREDLLTLRHIIIDLCLTIPARLSSLLPHLPLLVRIIIPALCCESGDLVNLG